MMKTGSTILMRVKQNINDYRYFPEPDIPYVYIDEKWIDDIKKSMPVLPDVLRERYKELKINDININTLIKNKDLTTFFNQMLELDINPVICANLLTGDVLAYLNKHNIKIEDTKLDIDGFKN